ncbi:hypothetical protein MPTK2_8g14850 [Marchantia polymorpha subsp. ruderalis]
MAKNFRDMTRENFEDSGNERAGGDSSNNPRSTSGRNGEAIDISWPTGSGAAAAASTSTTQASGYPGNMSLVVAATLVPDQLSSQGRSEDISMRDNDRPILHTEFRVDGCLKPDGKLGPLKSLNIRVHDDDGDSQPRIPGSPQRSIRVIMSDGSRTSDAGRRSPGRSPGRVMNSEDGRVVGAGRQQQYASRNAHIVVEEPFNVHRYQTRMLGDQPQGLAAALTDLRPELLPPSKEPQGLATVLFLDSGAEDTYPEQDTAEGSNHITPESRENDSRPVVMRESASQYQISPMRSMSREIALEPAEMYAESFHRGEEGRRHTEKRRDTQAFSSQEVESSAGRDSPSRNGSCKPENLHILQSLPEEVVSSLVTGHAKKVTASEGSERGGRNSPRKSSHRRAPDMSNEGSQSRDRSMHYDGEDHLHKRQSRNVHGTPRESGSSTYTSYYTSSSRADGSFRPEGRASQRSSRKVLEDVNEQSEAGYDRQSSVRQSRSHSGDGHGTPGSSYGSYFTNSNSRASGSLPQRSSRKLLEGVNEDHEVSYDNDVPPPPPQDSQISEDKKDQRRRTHKASQREPGGSVSFRSSDLSGDDRSRLYGSTYRTKSHTGSFLGPPPSDQTRDPGAVPNSKPRPSDDRMLSISKLLDNMTSITQLLSNIPQQQVGGGEPWNQGISQGIPDANIMNRNLPQYMSNDGNWQFDQENKRPSHLLIEGAPPSDGPQPNQFMEDGPPQQSALDILPSQDEKLNNRPSQMLLNTINSQQPQLQGGQSQQFQNSDNRSSQFMNGRSSQMQMPDSSFLSFDALDNRQSQLFQTRPSQIASQIDGSQMVDAMNRSSQLHVQEDGSPQLDLMMGQQSQILTSRLSQQHMPGDNTQQIFPLESRPSQSSSQEKDALLFNSMNSRPSQLQQRQSNKLSQQFDNLNSRPSQMKLPGDGSQQFDPMNGQLFDLPTSRPSQLSHISTIDNRASQILNSRPSQLMTNRLSQQQIIQGDSFQQTLPSDSRPSQMLLGRPSQLASKSPEEDFAQLSSMSRQASQLMTNRLSQQQNIQGDNFQQILPPDSRPSQMLPGRPSQTALQGTGMEQAAGSMNNDSSQFVDTRLSQVEMQRIGSRIMGSLMMRPSQLNIQATGTQHPDSMNRQPSQIQRNSLPQLSRPSQLVNTRPSQSGIQDANLQQFDGMNSGSSQVDKRMSGGSRILGSMSNRTSQLNMQETDIQNLQQIDPMNSRSSQVLNNPPSQMGMQGDGSQQFNNLNMRPSQLLNARASQTILQDNLFQQFDPTNSRPSQLLNSRPSQISHQDNGLQQVDPLTSRASQLLNARPSQNEMLSDGLQQFDNLNPRPSRQLQTNMRPSQLQIARPSQLQDTRPSQINARPSQLANTRPSQFIVQDDGMQQFDSINGRPSQFLNTRPSQVDVLHEGLQQSDPMGPRRSQLASSRPSQNTMRPSQLVNSRPSQFDLQGDPSQQFDSMNDPQFDPQGDPSQEFDPTNEPQSELMNQRASQFSMQDGETEEFDPMNPRPSQIMNPRPSQIDMQDDDSQQYDIMEPRPSYLLGSRQSQMMMRQSQLLGSVPAQLPLQPDGAEQFEPMEARPSQFMNTRPSQIGIQDDGGFENFEGMNPRPSQYANMRGSQTTPMNLPRESRAQQFDSMNVRPSQLMQSRLSQPLNRGPSQFDIQSRPSQLSTGRPSQVPSQQLNNFQQISQSMTECDNCADPNHEAVDCPIEVCCNCEEPGHYARQCVNPPMADQGEPYTETLQQEGTVEEMDEGFGESENAAQIGDSPQVLETLGTVDDSENLQTRELDIPDDENMEADGSSEYTHSTE